MLFLNEDLERMKARILYTLKNGLQFDLSTTQSKQLLKRHVNTNTTFVVMFVDINGSTGMSLSLPPIKFASIVQIFSQESGLSIVGHGGYILKYVGDAIIGIFPAEFDQRKACENAINCAIGIISIIRDAINPILNENDLPEITVKVGLEYGTALVVLYGKSLERAPIDLIGPSISIAAKITTIAQPNQIIIGHSIFEILEENYLQDRFINIKISLHKWNYLTNNGNIYQLYSYKSN